jgi:hypothetical protein
MCAWATALVQPNTPLQHDVKPEFELLPVVAAWSDEPSRCSGRRS